MDENEQKDDKKEAKAPTIQDQVNTLLDSMVEEDGKYVIPEDKLKDLPEAVVYAAKVEKRFRDTQSAYTKSRQKLKEFETVNKELTEHVIKNATMHLSQDERDELDDLRTSNPEAWREKLNEHEQKAKELQSKKIEEFQSKGKKASEEELRKTAYNEFKERTGIELSDQVIENELPASFMKKVESGEWAFDKFLLETEKYLSPNKKIKGSDETPTDKGTNLSKLPGGSTPSSDAVEADAAISYSNEIF
jgi:hypothetical protein